MAPKAAKEVDKVREYIKTLTPWGDEEPSDDEAEPERDPMFPGSSPTLVTSSSDTTIRKWDLKTGDCQQIYAGHEGPTLAMCMDYNSWMAFTGSSDNSVALWDLREDKWMGSLTGHAGAVSGATVDWEAERAVTSSFDHDLILWDLKEAELVRTMKGHSQPVSCVSGNWKFGKVASGSADSFVKIWDVETGRDSLTLKGHMNSVWTVSYEPLGNMVFTGSMDRHVMLWDLRTGNCECAMLRHEGYVTCVSVDWMDTQRAITTSCDRTICLWDLRETSDVTMRLTEHSGSVWCVDVDWPGNRMVTGAGPGDNAVRLWDLTDGFCVNEIDGHDGSIWNVFVDWEVAHKAKRELAAALKQDDDDYAVNESNEVKRKRRLAATAIQSLVRGVFARDRVRLLIEKLEHTEAVAEAERLAAMSSESEDEEKMLERLAEKDEVKDKPKVSKRSRLIKRLSPFAGGGGVDPSAAGAEQS